MVRISFIIIKHPLAIGIILIVQRLVISIIIGLISKTFWFSYILFLVFLGGILVLFIYVTSLASNEIFSFSFKIIVLTISLFIGLILITLFMDYSINIFINNNEIINYPLKNFLAPENLKSIYKLYNFPTNWITLLLINYLFFTLIVSVKITNFFYGPLRNLK